MICAEMCVDVLDTECDITYPWYVQVKERMKNLLTSSAKTTNKQAHKESTHMERELYVHPFCATIN